MPNLLETMKLHAATQVASMGQARHAVVSSVDPVAHAVKVTIQPEGLESGWIPDATLAAGGLRIMCPSEIGSQVVVLPMEGDAEHPVVIGRIFDVATTPSAGPVSGLPVQAGELAVVSSGGASLHIAGNTIYIGGIIRISGTLSVSGDITAGAVSLKHHVHGGVETGREMSQPPVAQNA